MTEPSTCGGLYSLSQHSTAFSWGWRMREGVPNYCTPATATELGVDGVKAGWGRLGARKLEHSSAWCIFHWPDVPQLTWAARGCMRQSRRVFWPLGSTKEVQACPALRRHKGISKLWSLSSPTRSQCQVQLWRGNSAVAQDSFRTLTRWAAVPSETNM